MIDLDAAQLLTTSDLRVASYFDGKHGFEEAKFAESNQRTWLAARAAMAAWGILKQEPEHSNTRCRCGERTPTIRC